MFDVTDRATFENINTWMKQISNNVNPEEVKIIMLGNKTDLEDDRQVSEKEGEEMAQKHGLTYYEASAKSGQNVKEAFEDLANKIHFPTV